MGSGEMEIVRYARRSDEEREYILLQGLKETVGPAGKNGDSTLAERKCQFLTG